MSEQIDLFANEDYQEPDQYDEMAKDTKSTVSELENDRDSDEDFDPYNHVTCQICQVKT